MKNIKHLDDERAQVTKAFMKNAAFFGTPEFDEWRAYLACYPGAKMVTKTIHKKADKKVETKNMTYKNMALYIKEQKDSDEAMKEFQKQIRLSKVQANPYRYVLAWFMKKYKNVNNYHEFFDTLSTDKSADNQDSNEAKKSEQQDDSKESAAANDGQ